MARVTINDLDYLAARIHGRRGRMAEAERLDRLCQLRSIAELSEAVFPDADVRSCSGLQRWAIEDWLAELTHSSRFLDEAGDDLLRWMLVRFQVENMKVLLRGLLNHAALETLQDHLISLPADLALDAKGLLTAGTLDEFADRLPRDVPRKALRVALGNYRGQSRPFVFEAALDQGYFEELLARAGCLSDLDREVVSPIVDQEVNMFQLMLVVRGRFGYDLTPEFLLPLHIRSSEITTDTFNAMLASPNLQGVAVLAVGKVIDDLPSGPESGDREDSLAAAALEAAAWRRFLRLANRAFRRSHMGLGAIMGYAGIRRVEVVNLITLSEGIRAGVASEVIRARLVPRRDEEVAYV